MIRENSEINELIDGCIKDNRRAQEKLYRCFYKALMNLCLRYTKNETDAMEALNTGYCKVFKNIRQYDSAKGSLYTWMARIIIHSCIDFARKDRQRITEKKLDEAVEVPIAPEIISKIKADELLCLIRDMQPTMQTVFNLYVMEGYTHREIGQVMNFSEGTSKWYLCEARKHLQSLIIKEKCK